MKQQLEQITNSYQSRKKTYFVIGDLESLSASVLYTGDLPSISGAGFDLSKKKDKGYGIIPPIFFNEEIVDADSINGYEPVKIKPNENLTIRDFLASRFQLHIHEGMEGTSHITKYGTNKIISELNSYDAAMGDLLADELDIKKILKKHGIKS